MNRILLYVHFNKHNELSEYVVYQLREMKPLFRKIVFITNSKLSMHDQKQINQMCDVFVQRQNIGYDHAAWRDGMHKVGWAELSKYDNITLMNDTCFGPIYPMNDVYKDMEDTKVDFWGITDHIYSDHGMPPGDSGPIPHHIQSYLTVYNRNVVMSKTFQDFWDKVKDYKNVEKVIQEYETQLTGILSQANFLWRVWFDTQAYSHKFKIRVHNYSEILPIIILKNKVPLLKIKSFIHTPKKTIQSEVNKTDYPLELIDSHLKKINLISISRLKYRAKSTRIILRRQAKMIYNKLNDR